MTSPRTNLQILSDNLKLIQSHSAQPQQDSTQSVPIAQPPPELAQATKNMVEVALGYLGDTKLSVDNIPSVIGFMIRVAESTSLSNSQKKTVVTISMDQIAYTNSFNNVESLRNRDIISRLAGPMIDQICNAASNPTNYKTPRLTSPTITDSNSAYSIATVQYERKDTTSPPSQKKKKKKKSCFACCSDPDVQEFAQEMGAAALAVGATVAKDVIDHQLRRAGATDTSNIAGAVTQIINNQIDNHIN